MTLTAKVCRDERTDWDEALSLYRGQLCFYLEYLIHCECSREILANVEAEVRKRSVPDDFKRCFLARTLVRDVIQHLRECNQQNESSQRPAQDSRKFALDIQARERLVYFMRDILEYSKRDTSLLIGTTDQHVENLLSLARRRIDMNEGPSFLEIQAPESTYFRWKFESFHLS